MSFFETVAGWWKQEQIHWTLVPLVAPAGVTPLDGALPPEKPIQPGKAYVHIAMRSMSIAASRIGWTRFHAALNTRVGADLRDGSAAEIHSVLAPDGLRELDPSRMQNVLHIDRTIFGPVPYIGGPIKLSLGVIAVKHADLATPFLNVLQTLGTAAGVAFIGAAQPFIGPIKAGIDMLTGSADATQLQIAIVRELNPPVTGWYALVRVAGATVRPTEFSVAPGNFELLRNGKSMRDVPYLVYAVDAVPTRHDWARIPELRASYADFAREVRAGHATQAGDAAKSFARIALMCPELLKVHVDDVVAAVNDELRRAFSAGDGAKGGGSAPESFAKASSPDSDDDFANLRVNFR